jgi:hypothetical protein
MPLPILSTENVLPALKRAVVGFVAGFVIAFFVLTFTGALPTEYPDATQPEIDQFHRSLWLAVYIAAAIAVVGVFAGKKSVPIFWLGFVIAFGIICLIPWWPDKSGRHYPLGAVYVNEKPWHHASVLVVHVGISLAIALAVHLVTVRRSPSKVNGRSGDLTQN